MSNPGSKYVQALRPNPRVNNGTVAGGLAHVLQSGLHAYALRQAEEEAKEKQAGQRSMLADMLRGVNRDALSPKDESGAMGPTVEAAARSRIENPEGLAGLLMSDNPGARSVAMAQYERAMRDPEKPEAYTLSPGQRRYVGDTEVAAVPSAPRPLSPRDAAFASLTPEQQQQVLMRPAASVNVNAATQEREEQKARGKLLVDRFSAVAEAGDSARQQIAQLQQAKSISTGPEGALPLPGQLRQQVGNMAVSLGFNPESLGLENITQGQQFNGVMQNLVLSKMQAQKGPQTENDAKRLEMTVASLGNTPEARTFLLDSAIAMNEMNILRQAHWQDHYARTGSYDGAETAWTKGLGGQRMVAKNPKSGRTVFLPQFISTVQSQHPDASLSEILDLWGSYE